MSPEVEGDPSQNWEEQDWRAGDHLECKAENIERLKRLRVRIFDALERQVASGKASPCEEEP